MGLAKTRFATKLAAMRLLAALVRTTVASMPFSLAALANSAATLATIAVMDLSPLPAGGSDEDFFARDGEVLRGARGRDGEGGGGGGEMSVSVRQCEIKLARICSPHRRRL